MEGTLYPSTAMDTDMIQHTASAKLCDFVPMKDCKRILSVAISIAFFVGLVLIACHQHLPPLVAVKLAFNSSVHT